jgi:hypothetical protein
VLMNDADLEMAEYYNNAVEDENETCRSCSDAYSSITIYVSPRGERPHFEVYECVCGHNTIWQDHRRLT